MKIDKIEIWIHDYILKNEKFRHFAYGMYQRILYMVSEKVKCEGNIVNVTPDDGLEYLFGYYDKCPWDPRGRFMLALRVKNSSSEADSAQQAEIVTIDLNNGNAIKVVAKTHCWNVQQGCMAQWMDDKHILYNDYRNGSYCSVVLNLENGDERIIEKPVYTVSSD